MTERNGTFVSVEGIDGSGKTTLVKALDEQFDSITTSEPSDFWTGRQVRRALQSETPPFVDFFLFMADRHMHITELIKPAVNDGETVISDRFADSTRVYQPEQLNTHMKSPRLWIEAVMEPWNYSPDILIYLDIDVDTALERAEKDEKYENREMLENVKKKYDLLIEAKLDDDDRPECVIIDGKQPKSDVVGDAVYALETRL